MYSFGDTRKAVQRILALFIFSALLIAPSAMMAQTTDTASTERVKTIGASSINPISSSCSRCSHYAEINIPHRAKITQISLDYEFETVFADVELLASPRLNISRPTQVISAGNVIESQCFNDCVISRLFNFRVDNIDWNYQVRVYPLGQGEITPQRIRVHYTEASVKTSFLDLTNYRPLSSGCEYGFNGSGQLIDRSGCVYADVLNLPDGVKIEAIDAGFLGPLHHISIYADTGFERFLVARVSASECVSGSCSSNLFGGLYSTTLSVIDNGLYTYSVEVAAGTPDFFYWQPFTLDRLAVLYR